MAMKRGERPEDDGIWLPVWQTMKDLGESGYKYLGILESEHIKMKKMKKKITNEYKRRLNYCLSRS